MTISADDQRALDDLAARLKIVLPPDYQDSYENIQPVSMGSAGLKFAADGRVAWDEIWGSFCDLAMAGGPPHKGALLEPGARAEVEASPDRYQEVVHEICRGVTMATELPARDSLIPGWVRVESYSESMAGWLLRAIVMENVAVRAEGRALHLPAAPGFRLEKEIKNVITVIAKTCHYWTGHMPRPQRQAIGELLATLAIESPLITPSASDVGGEDEASVFTTLAGRVSRELRLRTSYHRYAGWLGVECPSVHSAVWMMRALVVSNVLSRREGGVLFVPINSGSDPHGDRVLGALVRVHGLAVARGVLGHERTSG